MAAMTFDLANFPPKETIQLLACLLERMTVANDQLPKSSGLTKSDKHSSSSTTSAGILRCSQASTVGHHTAYTRFHSRSTPSINIYAYLSRILKYCPCANECFLSILVYFDRMSKNASTWTGQLFAIDSCNIHRLIIAGVMIASKFFSDVFYTNTRYAKVGGLSITELNLLELEFLRLSNYDLNVSVHELQRYGDQLLKLARMEQDTQRTLYDLPIPDFTNHALRSDQVKALGTLAHEQKTSGASKRSSLSRKFSVEELSRWTSCLGLDDDHSNCSIPKTEARTATSTSPAKPSLQVPMSPNQSSTTANTHRQRFMRKMMSVDHLRHMHYIPACMRRTNRQSLPHQLLRNQLVTQDPLSFCSPSHLPNSNPHSMPAESSSSLQLAYMPSQNVLNDPSYSGSSSIRYYRSACHHSSASLTRRHSTKHLSSASVHIPPFVP